MKKHYTALLAALVITLCLGAGMILISANALLNPNGVPAANSPAQAVAMSQGDSQSQVQQLQNLVSQYQTRETQYQNELKSAGQDLQQAQDQIQQYQMILQALQDRGYIVIRDGRVFIR